MPAKAFLHLCLEPWSHRGEQHLVTRASQIKANFFQHLPPCCSNGEHVIVIDIAVREPVVQQTRKLAHITWHELMKSKFVLDITTMLSLSGVAP